MIRSCLRAIENLKAATDTDTNLKFVEFYGNL